MGPPLPRTLPARAASLHLTRVPWQVANRVPTEHISTPARDTQESDTVKYLFCLFFFFFFPFSFFYRLEFSKEALLCIRATLCWKPSILPVTPLLSCWPWALDPGPSAQDGSLAASREGPWWKGRNQQQLVLVLFYLTSQRQSNFPLFFLFLFFF